MPSGEPPHVPAPSIFISYASQDRQAARSLRDALAAAGFDVWYDESELGGGDAWDQKIRRQIRECTYFMPVISANSNARHEGYFRREWRLAVERTLDMADDVTFIVPVTVDATSQAQARVPDKFISVQWLSVPDGRPTPAFEGWCKRLLGGDAAPPSGPAARPGQASFSARSVAPAYPPFPEQRPGQKLHFLFSVAGWMLRTAWIRYRRLPRGWRRVIGLIIAIFLLDKMCSSHVQTQPPTAEQKARARKILSDLGEKFDAASRSKNANADPSKMGADIAAEINRALGDKVGRDPEIVAVPFQAPSGDPASARFAGTVFASLYGQLSIAASGKIALAAPGSAGFNAEPVAIARERSAEKVLFGSVKEDGDRAQLEVTLEDVGESKVLWSGSFPVKGSDPVGVADEIRSHVQSPN